LQRSGAAFIPSSAFSPPTSAVDRLSGRREGVVGRV
jgi:hypothetical protein